MDVFDRVAEKVRRGNVVLWVGAGMSSYAGIPRGSEMVEQLIKESSSSEREQLRRVPQLLPDVTEEFVQLRNDSYVDLYRFVEQQIDISPKDLKLHKMLSQIPQIKAIITTNYDTLFEYAYGNNLVKLVADEDVGMYGNDRRVRLYKVHGDLSCKPNMVLTKSNYTSFAGQRALKPIWNAVKTLMMENVVLFLGYSMDDSNFQVLLDTIVNDLDNLHQEGFVVAPHVQDHRKVYFARRHIHVIESSVEVFVPRLHEQVFRHILEDAQAGFVDLRTAAKLLEDRGIHVGFSVNAKTIEFETIGVNDPDKHQELRVDLEPNTEFEKVFSGEVLEAELPVGSVKRIESEVDGIIIPVPGELTDHTLVVTREPDNTFDATLTLSPSRLKLDNVKVKVYGGQTKAFLIFERPSFQIRFSIIHGQPSHDVHLSLKKPRDVQEGVEIASFFVGFGEGDLLSVRNHTEGRTFPLGGAMLPASSEAFKSMVNRRQFYMSLQELEDYYQVYFRLPDRISEADSSTLNRLTCIRNGELEHLESITATVSASDKIDVPGLIRGKEVHVRLVDKPDYIEIFGASVFIGYPYVEAPDMYLRNTDEVQEQIQRGESQYTLELGSRSDKLYQRYIRDLDTALTESIKDQG